MSQQLLLLMLIGYLIGVASNRVHCRLATVNRDCPRGCVCRRGYIVDCGYAGLETIPPVSPKTRRLILDGNRVTNIRGEDISRMVDLKELYLHGNKIANITGKTFRQLLRLRVLDLSHNPLRCDCNLKSELEMSTGMEATVSLQVLNLEGTTCSFPEQVGGKPVRIIHSGATDCHQREKRRARHGGFCDGEPCKNGGTCLPTDAVSGWCKCPTGFGGEYCEWHRGDWLSLRVGEVSSYHIAVQWSINMDVMDFRIKSVENPTEASPIVEREWLNGNCTTHKLLGLRPNTLYEICVEAYGYGMPTSYAKSPGSLIEEVCLYQKTDPVPSTTEDSPDNKTPQRPTLSLDSGNRQDQTKMVMTFFGIILFICVVLILPVLALYVSRRRGIRLLPRRRWRRHTPPNIVQVDNPTYGSTGSPASSVHDLPIEEGEEPTQGNDLPLILVTSASNEDIVNPNGAWFGGSTTRADTDSVTSPQDAHETEGLSQRGDGDGDSFHEDGDSFHEDDFENNRLVKDKTEPDRPEIEVIQC